MSCPGQTAENQEMGKRQVESDGGKIPFGAFMSITGQMTGFSLIMLFDGAEVAAKAYCPQAAGGFFTAFRLHIPQLHKCVLSFYHN